MQSKKLTRYGAHGILIQDSSILLAQKKSGPYVGLWGLPGGAMEFGESPEDTLVREFLEETALAIKSYKLDSTCSHVTEFEKEGESWKFHHIGIIYRVFEFELAVDYTPEEITRWAPLANVSLDELTPFAIHALKHCKV